jgi:hypothetical protein
LTLSTTVTVIPPGSTVSCPPTVSRSLALTVTVVLAPSASVPDDGATVRPPTRPCDGVMDQVTGPPEAVSVKVAELPTLSRIVVELTLSVPPAGGGGVEAGGVVPLVDGAGEAGSLVAPDDDGAGAVGDVDAGGTLALAGAVAGAVDDLGEAGPAGEPPPAVGDGAPAATGAGEAGRAPLAGPVGRGLRLGLPGAGPMPGAAPVLLPGTGPLVRAAEPLWCPGPPLASATPITAAATTAATAPPTAARFCQVRHHGDFGGSTGLGKPSGPNSAACCATLARWAMASGVLLLASLSTCPRMPAGMAAMGSVTSGARPSSRAGASSRRFRSAHTGQRSMWRLSRLRISTVSCPSQSLSSALRAAQSSRPVRATSSAPSEASS